MSVVIALGLLISGCAQECRTSAYDIETSVPGEVTPQMAIGVWGDHHLAGRPSPPDGGWVEEGTSNEGTMQFTNDGGSGWTAVVSPTDSGGWVVSAASWGPCQFSR
ncbi:MAG: hypothetical protein ABWY58_00625 [Aeromicrobium sp.]